METYIYSLSDPSFPELVMYVGKANNLKRRLRSYCDEYHLQKDKSPVHVWISGLKAKGKIPIIAEIEKFNKDIWREREIFWIAYYRAINFNLLNVAKGGNGLGDRRIQTVCYVCGSSRARIPKTSFSICKVCRSRWYKSYYLKNKAKMNERSRKYREKNRAHLANLRKERKERYRKQINTYRREYYHKNKGRINFLRSRGFRRSKVSSKI